MHWGGTQNTLRRFYTKFNYSHKYFFNKIVLAFIDICGDYQLVAHWPLPVMNLFADWSMLFMWLLNSVLHAVVITRVLPALPLGDTTMAFDDRRVQFCRAGAATAVAIGDGGDVIEALYVQWPFRTHQVSDGGRNAC